MGSQVGKNSGQKGTHERPDHDNIHRVGSTLVDESITVNRPSREGTPRPQNEYKPEEETTQERKSMEDDLSGGDESIMIPVESTKLSPILELGTPGSSIYPEAPAVANSPDSNNNIPITEDSSNEKYSRDIPLPPCLSSNTQSHSSSSLVCSAIAAASPDLNPPSPFTLYSELLIRRDQRMENKDMTITKRKRKSPSVGLSNQKPKKPKIVAEPKKAPACKSCYHKHIGCDRQDENEPCRACEKRKQPCERNDVRVVKGEKTVVKKDPVPSESSHVVRETSQEGGFVAPSSIRAVSVTGADGDEDQNESGREVEEGAEEAASKSVFSECREGNRSHQVEAHVGRAGIEGEEAGGNGYAVMTDAEKEAVKILMGMKGVLVEQLNEQTSDCYFEAIRGILIEEVEDERKGRVGLKMLEKLKWQMTWLGGYDYDRNAIGPSYD
ncbi:hypothetical protein TWF788_009481 [Orbilia oligospora]|uniref:Zn(2)-C6 fungal-type domain-containing protein n=1 Tax=Orbilia oligospora TaxID=2813651 RepID=A0A7C8KL59_ORBOL|nr:hypothetical protein TWF788_009481 [Orbilia oligospora]